MKRQDATPQDIRRMTREIQDGWTRQQEWNRAGFPTKRWRVPVVPVGELAAAIVVIDA